MRIGKMRHYVSIERKTVTGTGDRGQTLYAWQPLFQLVPAAIEPLQGRKAEIARQLVATATHTITLRWHNMNEKDRIVYQGRAFNVGHLASDEERNRMLVLTCTEDKAAIPAFDVGMTGGLDWSI